MNRNATDTLHTNWLTDFNSNPVAINVVWFTVCRGSNYAESLALFIIPASSYGTSTSIPFLWIYLKERITFEWKSTFNQFVRVKVVCLYPTTCKHGNAITYTITLFETCMPRKVAMKFIFQLILVEFLLLLHFLLSCSTIFSRIS